jgi:hypothetical protein
MKRPTPEVQPPSVHQPYLWALVAGSAVPRRRFRVSRSNAAGIVGLVHPPGDARAAIARDPDDRPVDAGVKVSAALVVGEESVQLGQ